MKRLIFLLVAMLFNFIVFADDKNSEKQISLDIRECLSDTDRAYSPKVSATYYVSYGVIQIDLFEAGNHLIYLVDSNGQVVDFQESLMGETTICLNAPSVPGYYYLVVESSRLYAEGIFEVK